MRRKLIYAIVLALLPAAVAAQERPARPGGHGPMNPARTLVERRSELALSDEQVTKLEDLASRFDVLHEVMRDVMHERRAERARPDSAQRAAMRETRAQVHALREELRSVLTEQQIDQIRAQRPERGERPMMRRRRGGGDGPGALRLGPRGSGLRWLSPPARGR